MMQSDRRNGAEPSLESDRYRPAATYVELDRIHRKRSRWTTVLVVAIVILVVSLSMLGIIGYSYLQGQQKYGRIAQDASLDSADTGLAGMTVDWEALRATNQQTVAWLYVPGTSMNYPVVRGSDNEYYLTHDFEGDQGWLANYGAIFMDWRNDPNWADEAYFVYGHHMNDGSMFADVAALADQQRFDTSRTIFLLSPNGNFRLRTFSLIHCAADDPIVQTEFSTPQAMQDYVQDKMDRSIVDAGAVADASQITKLFAFATCDNLSSGRYVLYSYIEEASRSDIVALGYSGEPSGSEDSPESP